MCEPGSHEARDAAKPPEMSNGTDVLTRPSLRRRGLVFKLPVIIVPPLIHPRGQS